MARSLLFMSPMYPPSVGGAQLHLHQLAMQMQRMGNRVRVVTQSTQNRTDWLRLSSVMCEPEEDFELDGIPIHKLGASILDRTKMAPWACTYYGMISQSVPRIAKVLEDRIRPHLSDVDLIHFSRIGREFMLSAALSAAHRAKVPLVLTPNHHDRWRGWRYVEYDRLYREADALIALTDAERELLISEKRVRPERVFVTGIGPILSERFDVAAFRNKYNLPDRYVLFLGQHYEYKGVGEVLKATEYVWKSDPNVHFVFVGPPTPFSKQLFQGINDPRLHLLGKVSLEEKTAALHGSEFLCVPSSQESFGGVYVEAWMCRKGVIGGAIAPIRAIVDEEKNGFTVERDPEKIAKCILKLWSDKAMSQAFGENGFRKATEKFSWEAIARSTNTVYEYAIGAKLRNESVKGNPIATVGSADR